MVCDSLSKASAAAGYDHGRAGHIQGARQL
jgi:hypothetical protein